MSRALLLPGWGTAPQRFEALAGRLRGVGIEAATVDYQASGSYVAIARQLSERVGRGDAPLHLVGHSLGGLVVAAAAAVTDLAPRVASVTTINAPWRGTWLGWTASGSLAESLRWRAAELAQLRAAVREHLAEDAGPRWLVLASAVDLGVPVTSGLRSPNGPRLRKRVVATTGHTPLASDPFVDVVLAHVTAAAVRPASPAPRRG